MATVTLYNHINFVAGGTLLQENRVNTYTSTTSDTLNLPLNTPQGFAARLHNLATNTTITVGAQSGEAVSGGTTIAPGQIGTAVKTGSTTWVCGLSTTGQPV